MSGKNYMFKRFEIDPRDTGLQDRDGTRIMEGKEMVFEQDLGGMADGGEREQYDGGCLREPTQADKGRYDLISPFAMRRLARWYALGAEKYGDRNWEKGMPYSRCVDSAKRHIDKFLMGWTDEDHLAAAIWNIVAIIHYEELGMREKWDDLPKYSGYFDTDTVKEAVNKEFGKTIEVPEKCKGCSCVSCFCTVDTCMNDDADDYSKNGLHCWQVHPDGCDAYDTFCSAKVK